MLLAFVINYVFHFYVGRTLGPEDYGIFGVLLSLIYIIVMPLMAIQTTLSRYVAELNIKNEKEKLSYLFLRSLSKGAVIGLVMSLLFIVISPLLSSFLKINMISPLIILGSSIVFAFLVPIVRGFLQGIQNFKLLGLTFIIESFSKIFFGIPLIFLGFGVNGAITGFALSFLLPLIILVYFVKRIFKGKRTRFNTSQIYKYSFPVLIMLLALTGLYTWDVVLVKRFFDPVEAGQYAALSLFGKIIFFATLSISMVMFPKILELNAQNKRSLSLLFKSILITLFLGLTASLTYFLMPEFIVAMLFGKEYLIISNLIWIFGVVMTMFSICYLISYYNIALHKIKFLYLLIFFNFLEILLITLFHNSITQILINLIIVMVLLFLSLIIYTIKNVRNINYSAGIQ
ncbi:oligosaccharide flippase family protein [Candidatus Woesearchaeota archaeon]|nr:oligosaccharide flippase family protein [Candidatus Woesearchaeota archaeon]